MLSFAHVLIGKANASRKEVVTYRIVFNSANSSAGLHDAGEAFWRIAAREAMRWRSEPRGIFEISYIPSLFSRT